MPTNSMHDPQYARRVWNAFRARRPPGRFPPKGPPAPDATQETHRLKDELADMFLGAASRRGGSAPRIRPPDQKGAIPDMIKLNAGISRKVGEPNYGSRGATVNVELELESGAAQDVRQLHERIRKLFAVARDAVNEELGLSTAPPEQNGHGGPPRNGNGGTTTRPASEAQIRAVNAICARLGLDAHKEAHQRLGRGIQEMTLREASRLIDELKALAPPEQ